MENTDEIKGRLMLWHSAILESKSILNISSRTKAEIKSGRPDKKEGEFSKEYVEYQKNQHDYKDGVINYRHFVEFNKIKYNAKEIGILRLF